MTDIVKHIESGNASSKTVKLLAELGQILREKDELKAGRDKPDTASRSGSSDRHSATASSMPYGSLPAPSGHQASYSYQYGSYNTNWPQSASTSSYETTATGGYTNIQQPMQSSYSAQSYATNWPTTTYDSSGQTGMRVGGNTASAYTGYTSTANTSGNLPVAPTNQTYPTAVNTVYPDQGAQYSNNATGSAGYSQQHTIPGIPGRQTPPHNPDLLSSELTPTQKNLLSDWQMITDTSVRNTDLATPTQGYQERMSQR
ncbi:uncharacterized protein [Amphiura filiformis]|uniref:uncharacterized protein n=1 Tax=Amphiura filiformis TaxID=82378 RepID=UPI003B21AC75